MKKITFLFVFIMVASFAALATPPVVYYAYMDMDGDGRAGKKREITAAQIIPFLTAGWNITTTPPAGDCNDSDPNVWMSVKAWTDGDGDKFITGFALLCIGSTVPAGYILTGDVLGYSDCNDGDPSVWAMKCCYLIADPSAPNVSLCVGAAPPAGYGFCPRPAGPVADLSFSVYPNPVSDRLNILPDENWNNRVTIKLVDQFGRVARTVNNPSAVKGQNITINTGGLNPGIYKVIIQSGESIQSKSIGIRL